MSKRKKRLLCAALAALALLAALAAAAVWYVNDFYRAEPAALAAVFPQRRNGGRF